MKKIILGLLMMSVLLVSVGMVVAKNPKSPADSNGLAHAGQASQLYLYEKNSTTWDIIEDGAWGKMVFSDDSFVFNGHGLDAGEDYSLIYYPDYSNSYNLDFLCTSGCSGTYTHTLVIDDLDSNGFTGTGYYNANNAYTWNVTGTSPDTFSLIYTGNNAGYTVNCENGSCTSSGQEFNLTATSLSSNPWPRQVEVIGSGVVNNGGNVNIMGSFEFDSIPWDLDLNDGAKIWLVNTDNLVSEKLTGWNPSEYLFEYNLI